MDSLNTLLGVVAVVASVAALVISSWIAIRQSRYSRDANHVPVLVEVLQQFRSSTFVENLAYVEKSLAADHPVADGISGLPSPARERVLDVAYYFQIVAEFVILDILDEDRLLLAMGQRLPNAWRALQPYILEERKLGRQGLYGFRYFEDLAVRSANKPLDEILRRLKVQRFDTALGLAEK